MPYQVWFESMLAHAAIFMAPVLLITLCFTWSMRSLIREYFRAKREFVSFTEEHNP